MSGEQGDIGGPADFSRHGGATTTIEVTGELDLAAAPVLGEEVERAFQDGATELVIDLGGVRFIDSAGLRQLLATLEECERRGCPLRLVPGPPGVQRVFEISGLIDHLPFTSR
jgi:anti-anti-sigma factor